MDEKGEQKVGANSGLGKRRRGAAANKGDNYAAKRLEIVHAATQVFRDLGYQKTTLGVVADQMGAERATLYYYFSNKEELLCEVIYDIVVDNVAQTARICALNLPVVERLALFVAQLMRTYETHYPEMYIFIEQNLGRLSPENQGLAQRLDDVSRECEAQFVALLAEGVETGDIRGDLPLGLVANAMFGMVNWTHRWFRPARRYSGADVANLFSTLLIEGVRKP